MVKPDQFEVVIAELQRQREDLERLLQDSDSARGATTDIIEKLADMKRRAEKLRALQRGGEREKWHASARIVSSDPGRR